MFHHNNSVMYVFGSGDCGVFALKCIEFLSTGKTNMEVIADKFMNAHRVNLAQSIWKLEWISL